MRKIVAQMFVSLDGVVEAPQKRVPSTTEMGETVNAGTEAADTLRNLSEAGGFICGRRTYEAFAGHWPNASIEEKAVADPLNKQPKYVASRTLSEPLEWQNSTLLHGYLKQAVAALKGQDGGDLDVIGSPNLVQGLFKENLVDELRVIFDPVTVGGGKRIFPEDGALRAMRLVESEMASTGGFIATSAVEKQK